MVSEAAAAEYEFEPLREVRRELAMLPTRGSLSSTFFRASQSGDGSSSNCCQCSCLICPTTIRCALLQVVSEAAAAEYDSEPLREVQRKLALPEAEFVALQLEVARATNDPDRITNRLIKLKVSHNNPLRTHDIGCACEDEFVTLQLHGP